MFRHRKRHRYRGACPGWGPEPVTLDHLPVGSAGSICGIHGERLQRRRLMEMGLLEGGRIRVVERAAGGDPIKIKVHDFFLSLRSSEAEFIFVRPLPRDAGEQE